MRHIYDVAQGGDIPTDVSGKDDPDAMVMIKNTSLPFTPGDSSTSCHGREQHEMGDEHSGLYTTTAGTSFLHDNGEIPLLPNVDVHEPGNGVGQLSDALLGMLR